MGGGVSSAAAEHMEEMVAYSVLLGRNITCMSFPGMHSIRDFNLLAQQKDQLTSASGQKKRAKDSPSDREVDSTQGNKSSTSNSSDSSGNVPPPLIDPELENKFTVILDGEVIVLDDVTRQNEDGWTPLHACCHSNTTAAAGLKILEEVVALGGDLNLKTKRGPGSFNSGFTALHMASAYGVADLVEALLKAGADPNCKNAFDWSPLLEVCHRGFASTASMLAQAGADLQHIPNADASGGGAHFMRGAPQSALGEAARGGFTGICKFLLDAGSGKDQKNHLGWTPLHEACYFNRLDTAQLFLVHGADPTAKNAQGAMPFNLASSQAIRELLREIGGEEATKIMPTPTFSLCVNEQGQMFVRVLAGKPDEETKGGDDGTDGKKEEASKKAKCGTASSTPRTVRVSPSRSQSRRSWSPGPGVSGGGNDARDQKDGSSTAGVLHRGEMLGELPALGRAPPDRNGGGNSDDDVGARRRHSNGGCKRDSEKNRQAGCNSGSDDRGRLGHENSLRLPGTTNEKHAPGGIICQLSKRVARDPVRTPYGHLFDRQMIALWLSKQGSICPLTGQPLVAAELISDEKVITEVQAWYRSLREQQKAPSRAPRTAVDGKQTKKPTVETVCENQRQPEGVGNKKTSTSSWNGVRSPSLSTANDDSHSARACPDALGPLDATAPPKDDRKCEGAKGGDGHGSRGNCESKSIGEDDDDGLYEF